MFAMFCYMIGMKQYNYDAKLMESQVKGPSRKFTIVDVGGQRTERRKWMGGV